MTDQELVLAAAKAAGIALCRRPFDHRGPEDSALTVDFEFFNPLHDDGDALRLAVKLEICVEFGDCADDSPVVYAGISHERRYWPMSPRFPDSAAATRRAIVRAATEIGKAMP